MDEQVHRRAGGGDAELSRVAAPSGTEARLWICPGCQYDLSGLPPDGVCPECGAERSAGTIHVGGWTDRATLPFGPTAHVNNLVGSLFLGAIVAGPLGIQFGLARLGVPWWGIGLAFAAVIFGLLIVLRGRSKRVGQRPLEFLLQPNGLYVSGHVWKPRLIPWSRYRSARVRRLGKGLWSLTLRAPFWRLQFRETIPWESGTWLVRVVFQGTRRDAALVRRVARRRVAEARRSGPAARRS